MLGVQEVKESQNSMLIFNKGNTISKITLIKPDKPAMVRC